MKILVFILILVFINGCGTRVSGSYEFLLQVNTFNKYNDPLESSCKLFSSETRMEFTSPSQIKYQANCGPINIICKTGTLVGEYGYMPKAEETINTNTILSTGAGIIFNRIVDSTTPFGMFIRYTNAFDDSTCLIPKKINIVVE
tara:strand:- start:1454 stop:1885 length:432 start_codon:yes stop_codon:yes gene_type:complete